MGMAGQKRAAGCERGRFVGCEARHVAVREEQFVVVDFHEGVVGHAGKGEHHLIHFGIAVAAYGHDAIRPFVQDRYDLLGSVSIGQVVAGAMVEQIA